MGFQVPFEIAQRQLEKLRITSLEARETPGDIHPFFDERGATRFLVIVSSQKPEDATRVGSWAVGEFPLEIRFRKAIYPHPILSYRPLVDLEPESFAGLYHFDPGGSLTAQPGLPEHLSAVLARTDLAARARGRESIRDLFFTLDLRRLTGGLLRTGPFLKRRLELAALRSFIQETAFSGA